MKLNGCVLVMAMVVGAVVATGCKSSGDQSASDPAQTSVQPGAPGPSDAPANDGDGMRRARRHRGSHQGGRGDGHQHRQWGGGGRGDHGDDGPADQRRPWGGGRGDHGDDGPSGQRRPWGGPDAPADPSGGQ